jgi:aminoglycoside phosphotransferase (APT) family kinase protein
MSQPDSITIRVFTGGQSNPTFHLQCTATAQQYVLRKKPAGTLLHGAHDVTRECAIFKALTAWGVPVPHVVSSSDDGAAFGTPYFVMKFVDGAVHREFCLPSLSPFHRRAVYTQAMAAMSHLHSVPIEAAGLSWVGKSQNYFSRVLNTWTKQ